MVNIILGTLTIMIYFSIVRAIFTFKAHRDAKELESQSGKTFKKALEKVIEENAVNYFLSSLFWVIMLPVEILSKVIFNFLNKYIKQ